MGRIQKEGDEEEEHRMEAETYYKTRMEGGGECTLQMDKEMKKAKSMD